MISCLCLHYDQDGPSCAREETRTARKAHCCCECRQEIKLGQRYQYVRGLWDGYWMTFKTCLPCRQIRADFMSCGFVYGHLWDDLQYSLGELKGDNSWLEVE